LDPAFQSNEEDLKQQQSLLIQQQQQQDTPSPNKTNSTDDAEILPLDVSKRRLSFNSTSGGDTSSKRKLSSNI